MESSTKRLNVAGDPGLDICAEWGAGPRTAAWDRLWRAIFRGLATEPTAGTAQQLGREGDDG